jgi:SAM-dependent methyltransferase
MAQEQRTQQGSLIGMADNYRDLIKQRVRDEATFTRLTLSGEIRGATAPWRRVIVRPVQLKSGRHLQFSYFDARQDTTKNYRGDEALARLDEVLAIPYSSVYLQSTAGNIRVQLTTSLRPIIHREKPDPEAVQPNLAHNQVKEHPLLVGRPDLFLQEIGIMNAQGAVLPAMQDKFTQINEFLKLLDHTGELERIETRPVQILDCGCGSSYLSLAAYHYLNNIRSIDAALTGIDTNARLIDKSNQHGERLGFDRICFQTSSIIDYVPEVNPDILIALHACDTATDDAIAQGILQGARVILCAPCCHHELHTHLHPVAPWNPVFQQGILKQRLGDILTDTFRALILRVLGYKTDVVEFVAPEHTDRNLMIRAVRRGRLHQRRALQEYEALKHYWGVTPYLEGVLAERGQVLPALSHVSQKA